jgi:hypothetical protein
MATDSSDIIDEINAELRKKEAELKARGFSKAEIKPRLYYHWQYLMHKEWKKQKGIKSKTHQNVGE